MGFLRLLTPRLDRLAETAVERTYMAGLDCVPMPCRKTWEREGVLRLERDTRESGNVHLPWLADGHGELLLSTATLMEREKPYDLAVEVARGTVNRLRSKAEIWRLAGLRLSDGVSSQIRAACQSFIQAATSQQDRNVAEAAARTAVHQALDAMGLLGLEYARQALEYRHEGGHPLPTLLAGNVGGEAMPANTEPMFRATFNAALIPLRWDEIQREPDRWDWGRYDKQVQWCVRNGLKIIGGPLVRVSRDSLPSWLAASASADPAALAKAARRFVETAVDRYRGQVHLWYGVATSASGSWLSDDQQLRLTVTLIEATRRRDPRTPVFLSVQQPWGEAMAFEQAALSPLQFVDFLLRADLEIAGIGLEIDYGYWPGGTLPRDVLEMTEHIDLWAMLGLPLIPMLTVPSSADPDPLATDDSRILQSAFPDGPSPQNQKRLLDHLLPALLAKQSVQAIICNQVFDSVRHRHVHGGLFTGEALPKPALNTLLALRREHLT